jgi:hypothetical protein
MLGQLYAVQTMVDAIPGIQSIPGPHGISLLTHAQNRLSRDIEDPEDKRNVEAVVAYLESLGDADIAEPSAQISETEKEQFIGKYIFGKGDRDYFEVNRDNRGRLSIARGEDFGRVLNRIDNSVFAPSGAPEVRISFDLKGNVSQSVTIHDPEPLLTATRP